MGAAFSVPLLDNGHSVTLTEPYNFKLLQKLNLKKKIHPSLNINLPQKLKINKFSTATCHLGIDQSLKYWSIPQNSYLGNNFDLVKEI